MPGDHTRGISAGYELRRSPDGPTIRGENATAFDAIQERPGYLVARGRLRDPMVSFVASVAVPGDRNVADAEGFLALRVSALRSSQGGERPMDVVHV